jgi:hypothetical protein
LCPAHPDRNPSLSAWHTDGKLVVHCFAGCSVEDIVHALGLTLADLFDEHLSEPDPLAEYRRRAVDGFKQWRDCTLNRIGHELRLRDELVRLIEEQVRLELLTEEQAWEYLEPLLTGYSELDHKFEILRCGTDAEALEVYRSE